MSRIGRAPIKLNQGISVDYAAGVVTVKGPLGTLTQKIENDKISVEVVNGEVHVKRASEAKNVKAAHGLYRALIHNMVVGVEKGYSKNLIINGVGYKAVAQGNKVVLSVGYSHTVDVIAPEGLKVEVVSPTEIRKPEPYHGYGIQYKDETILRKEGKTAGK